MSNFKDWLNEQYKNHLLLLSNQQKNDEDNFDIAGFDKTFLHSRTFKRLLAGKHLPNPVTLDKIFTLFSIPAQKQKEIRELVRRENNNGGKRPGSGRPPRKLSAIELAQHKLMPNALDRLYFPSFLSDTNPLPTAQQLQTVLKSLKPIDAIHFSLGRGVFAYPTLELVNSLICPFLFSPVAITKNNDLRSSSSNNSSYVNIQTSNDNNIIIILELGLSATILLSSKIRSYYYHNEKEVNSGNGQWQQSDSRKRIESNIATVAANNIIIDGNDKGCEWWWQRELVEAQIKRLTGRESAIEWGELINLPTKAKSDGGNTQAVSTLSNSGTIDTTSINFDAVTKLIVAFPKIKKDLGSIVKHFPNLEKIVVLGPASTSLELLVQGGDANDNNEANTKKQWQLQNEVEIQSLYNALGLGKTKAYFLVRDIH